MSRKCRAVKVRVYEVIRCLNKRVWVLGLVSWQLGSEGMLGEWLDLGLGWCGEVCV